MIFSDGTGTSWLSRTLNLLGVGAIAFYVSRNLPHQGELWMALVAALSLAAWLAAQIVPRRFVGARGVLLLLMVVAGGTVATATQGVTAVPVAIAVLVAVAELARPFWQALVLTLLGAAIVPLGIVIEPVTVLGLIALEGAIALAFLAGISRRQYRTAEAQNRLLAEERIAMREEQARGAALADRQRIARDMHDVLAHSLGGLVIQLDAVDALLEAGRTADARGRVTDARALAASGLDEARRAVGALREPDAAATHSGEELQEALAELADLHRSLGGRIRFSTDGAPHDVTEDEAQALRRAMQEALTNARKHAAGSAVTATLAWTEHGAGLEVTNPAQVERHPSLRPLPPSGQHGLVGMSERFDALAGASLFAGPRGGDFVVSARVGRA